MPRFVDLTGQKFGKLTVIERAENKGKRVAWKCLCECGKCATVIGEHLKNGHTSSCGCLMSATRKNRIDLTGQKFGKLTVLKQDKPYITSGGAWKTFWICQCECGNVTSVASQALRKNKTLSCGCYKGEKIKEVNFKDITGNKYGRLTAIRLLQKEERKTRGYNWLCQCECGNYVHANANKLKTGYTRSCGCLRAERIGELNKKYTTKDRRLYTVYKGILNRCYNETHREYPNYGGRGITVCEEWLGEYGFDKFAEWAYSTGYKTDADYGKCTIDRKDIDKNYCPENCRWITNKEQQNNRRDCRYIEHDGEVKTISQWAEYFGISYSKAYWHLGKQNRTVQELIDNFLN